ncbi:MAG: CotH kinase family protein [Planctomycetia bacterium]|nr:CotH kinase family protein [Planctomycetia bacterium]
MATRRPRTSRRLAPGLACLAIGAALVARGAPSRTARAADAPAPPPAAAPTEMRSKGDEAAAAWFAGPVGELSIELEPVDAAALRASPRTYVACRLREGADAHERVAVKLKGAAGSFRPLDEQPSFTLAFEHFRDGPRFHGLGKLHLNASVQDDTRLHEALCADLCDAAGVPAPRVTHARVRLDGRDLGLYVVKEGVDKRFLARHFDPANGNLYDGGFCTDVDGELEKDAGKGPDDRRDLAALVAACQEPDLTLRPARLEAVLDVEAFLGFVALERMLGHWDGYATNRNNYRLYLRPPGVAVFLPHGMDQVFQDPEASVLDPCVGLVADAVLAVPAFRARYRARLAALLPLFDAERSLLPRLRARLARLAPAVTALGPDAAAAHAERVADLEARLVARAASLREQVKRPDPQGLEFDAKGRAFVAGFTPRVDEGEATLEQEDRAGRRAYGLRVAPGASVVASWRRRVVLPKGRYTLEGALALRNVTPRRDAEGSGAGLRLSGGVRKGGASGSAPWKAATLDFEVLEALASVELVAELRATSGEAWWAVDAFRLVRRAAM